MVPNKKFTPSRAYEKNRPDEHQGYTEDTAVPPGHTAHGSDASGSQKEPCGRLEVLLRLPRPPQA